MFIIASFTLVDPSITFTHMHTNLVAACVGDKVERVQRHFLLRDRRVSSCTCSMHPPYAQRVGGCAGCGETCEVAVLDLLELRPPGDFSARTAQLLHRVVAISLMPLLQAEVKHNTSGGRQPWRSPRRRLPMAHHPTAWWRRQASSCNLTDRRRPQPA